MVGTASRGLGARRDAGALGCATKPSTIPNASPVTVARACAHRGRLESVSSALLADTLTRLWLWPVFVAPLLEAAGGRRATARVDGRQRAAAMARPTRMLSLLADVVSRTTKHEAEGGSRTGLGFAGRRCARTVTDAVPVSAPRRWRTVRLPPHAVLSVRGWPPSIPLRGSEMTGLHHQASPQLLSATGPRTAAVE